MSLFLAIAGVVEGKDCAEHRENEDKTAHVREQAEARSAQAMSC